MAREWTKEYWENARERARAVEWRRIPMWSIFLGAFVALIAVVIAFWNWNIIKHPLERLAASALGRQVTVDGDVNVDLGWTSHVTLNRVNIGQPLWAQHGGDTDMARVDRISADVRLWPLLHGWLILPSVQIDRPVVELVREQSGRANWDFGGDGTTASSKDAELPPIGQLVVNNGHFHIVDRKHNLDFTGEVESHEGPHGEAAHAFALNGQGIISGHAFSASMNGDSPLRATGHPYDFNAHMKMGASAIAARGTIPRPFNLDGIVATLEASGDDLANLYFLTGLALPDTPPYRLHGRLTHVAEVWKIDRFGGNVGHTDIAGWLSVQSRNDRPFLQADLKSTRATMDDVMAVFGDRQPRHHAVPVPAATGAITITSGSASHEAEQTPASGGAIAAVLPDAPLRVERVRKMDARVHYTAGVIATGGVPMRDLAVNVKLDHGVLTVDPARVTLALGKVAGRATIDARQNVPDVAVDVRLTDARIEQFFHASRSGELPLSGALEATAHLRGKGVSVYQAVANASGDIHLAVPHGEVRQAIAELLGINILNGLGLMLTKDETTTPLRCAVADFHADNGRLTVRRFAIDTGVVLATGTGSADLRNETMDLRIEGRPKKFRLGRVMAPITISGSWAKPHIGIEAGKALVQAGLAGALGAVINPVAALIPFVSTGSQEDVDCGRLLAQTAYNPAPAAH